MTSYGTSLWGCPDPAPRAQPVPCDSSSVPRGELLRLEGTASPRVSPSVPALAGPEQLLHSGPLASSWDNTEGPPQLGAAQGRAEASVATSLQVTFSLPRSPLLRAYRCVP